MDAYSMSLIIAELSNQAAHLDVPDGPARASVMLAINDLLAAKSKLQRASRLQESAKGQGAP